MTFQREPQFLEENQLLSQSAPGQLWAAVFAQLFDVTSLFSPWADLRREKQNSGKLECWLVLELLQPLQTVGRKGQPSLDLGVSVSKARPAEVQMSLAF